MVTGPAKWREPCIDPFAISLGDGLSIIEVVGYPHAGNDVFACVGQQNGRPVEFYLKVARHRDADLENEAAALGAVCQYGLRVPSVLGHGWHKGYEYLAVSGMPGERLSVLLSGRDGSTYRHCLHRMLREMGRSLGRIHSLPLAWRPVRLRRQHQLPVFSAETSAQAELAATVTWLKNNRPTCSAPVFVHGDHHYANILWAEAEITAVLDWELCGTGWREFDLAWAVAYRPSQAFLNTSEELASVLEGYQEVAQFDQSSFVWCLTLVYCHFLGLQGVWEDEGYRTVALEAVRKRT